MATDTMCETCGTEKGTKTLTDIEKDKKRTGERQAEDKKKTDTRQAILNRLYRMRIIKAKKSDRLKLAANKKIVDYFLSNREWLERKPRISFQYRYGYNKNSEWVRQEKVIGKLSKLEVVAIWNGAKVKEPESGTGMTRLLYLVQRQEHKITFSKVWKYLFTWKIN